MLRVIVVLLLMWLALAILGAVIEGPFWLTIVGAVLFVATAAYGAIKRRAGRAGPLTPRARPRRRGSGGPTGGNVGHLVDHRSRTGRR